jgi:hypothetical protein
VFVLLPITPRQIVSLILWSLGLTVLLIVGLGRYYAFYHLSTPGTGTALLLLVAPTAVLVSLVAGFGAVLLLLRRGVQSRNAFRFAALICALLFVGYFAVELQRTDDMRSGEGPGAGDLAPFFRSLIALK